MNSNNIERQKGIIKEIMNAIDTGEITKETIQKASERNERLKKKYLNWDNIKLKYSGVPEFVGGLEHKELAAEVYRNSTTIVRNEQLLPLSDEEKVLVICSSSDVKGWAENKDDKASNFGKA